MKNWYDEIRQALDELGIDAPAEALDRAAAVAAGELQIASKMPRLVRISGAEWVTVKARPDGEAETVGSLKRSSEVLVGEVEGTWRPVYGEPLGWISWNLVTLLPR